MPNDAAFLSDYFSIIHKRKRVILLIFGAAVLTSAIVSLLSKPLYEASATLEIGTVEDRLVMDKAATRELLTGNQLLCILDLPRKILELNEVMRASLS